LQEIKNTLFAYLDAIGFNTTKATL